MMEKATTNSILEDSVVIPTNSASCTLSPVDQMADTSMVVCHGISGYSTFRQSIEFDIKRPKLEIENVSFSTRNFQIEFPNM